MSDEDMEQLLTAIEERLGHSWVTVVEHLRDTNDIEDIARHLHAGDIDGAVQGVEQAAARFAASVADEYTTAGKEVASWLDGEKADRLVTFDGTNPRAVQWARDNGAELVRGVSQESRATITQAVSRGLSEGRNPLDVAKEVRDAIGLTPSQEAAVASYRRALEQGDLTNALGRQLSSGHSDRTIRAARDQERALTQQQIDLAVDRYRANYVDYRAQVIARTEGLRALHQGADEMIQQAIENGDVEHDELVQEWHTAGDGKVRESHRTVVADADGKKTKAVDDLWVTGDGNRLRFPGDPDAPIEETAQCRCVMSTTIDPSHQPKVDAPDGFSAGGKTVREGLPTPDTIREGTLYRVPVDDLASAQALPGAGADSQRVQSIRDAWAGGKDLPPLHVTMTESGDLFVEDGRHRLQVAREQGRDVLVRVRPGI